MWRFASKLVIEEGRAAPGSEVRGLPDLSDVQYQQCLDDTSEYLTNQEKL